MRELVLALVARAGRGDAVVDATDAEAWPPGAAEQMVALGVFKPMALASRVVCPGCDEQCVVRPRRDQRTGGLWHLCDGGMGLGVIPVAADARRRWSIDVERFAEQISRALHFSRPPARRLDQPLWLLGSKKAKGGPVVFWLLLGGDLEDPQPDGVQGKVVVLAPRSLGAVAPPGAPHIIPVALEEVVEVSEVAAAITLPLLQELLGDLGVALADAPQGAIRFRKGAGWENLTLRFLDEESVEVIGPGVLERRSYTSLGMSDGRGSPGTRSPPDHNWTLLRAFALGRRTWSGSNADGSASDSDRQWVSSLRAALKRAFALPGTPIGRRKKKKGSEAAGWTSTFNVVPTQAAERADTNVRSHKPKRLGRFVGIEDVAAGGEYAPDAGLD